MACPVIALNYKAICPTGYASLSEAHATITWLDSCRDLPVPQTLGIIPEPTKEVHFLLYMVGNIPLSWGRLKQTRSMPEIFCISIILTS
jgi:hypothetical protein